MHERFSLRRQSKRGTSGSTFLEVLVALFLFSLLLLFQARIQLSNFHTLQNAWDTWVADLQIQNLVGQLSASHLSSGLISEWQQQNAEVLVQGQSLVSKSGNGYRIQLHWGKHYQCAEERQCLRLENIKLGQY
jgi:Tfp pilus assembly protein PilV